jgi:hypothetical protein
MRETSFGTLCALCALDEAVFAQNLKALTQLSYMMEKK